MVTFLVHIKGLLFTENQWEAGCRMTKLVLSRNYTSIDMQKMRIGKYCLKTTMQNFMIHRSIDGPIVNP